MSAPDVDTWAGLEDLERRRYAALARLDAAAAEIQRQQTAADSFALGVFCALLALWFACRVSDRLHALLPGALVDGLDEVTA